MKNHTHKHIITAVLALMLMGHAGILVPVHAADPAPVTQSFTDSKGLTNISDPKNGGVDTKQLGIYGPDATGNPNLIKIISNIVNSVFLLLGFTAVVLLIIEGILLILSRGEEDRRKKVIATIINIGIGFGVILLSYAIVDQILRVLGDTNIQQRETSIQDVGSLGTQLGFEDVRNQTQDALVFNCQDSKTGKIRANCIPCKDENQQPIAGCATQIGYSSIPKNMYKEVHLAYNTSVHSNDPISGDYRSIDYQFIAAKATIPALRDNLLRLTQAEWAEVKKGTFGLFVPGDDTLQNIKAWTKTQFSYGVPADALSVSATKSTNADGTQGQLIDLSAIRGRLQEGIANPNYVQVNIPGVTTAGLTVVILKADEEDKFMFPQAQIQAPYSKLDPAQSGPWYDIAAGLTQGYDIRRSFFKVKEKNSSIDARSFTTGASVQVNDGADQKDIDVDITLDDKNTLPDTFKAVEHTLTRGDGVLIRDAAKSGDTFTVTVPLSYSLYVVDDITGILKDGKRVNLGTNTISFGNNSSPRYATLSSLGQLSTEGSYTDAGQNKTVKLIQGDSLALTKSGETPVTLKLAVKYFSKEVPTVIDVASPGIKDGFVRFVDSQIAQTGTPINGVTPYTVTPDLVFTQPGNYPVTLAIRDYAQARTLATMSFNVSIVTDGTALQVSPNASGVVGSTYSIRTFPAFLGATGLDSKRVEIVRQTDTGSGGTTVLNRTLTSGLDDFDYVFDQDGEYVLNLYTKFKGATTETKVSKAIVVMPQSPQVDFDIQEKPGNPTIFELTDLSRYVDNGTVFVDVNPASAAVTQTDWQTAGTKRTKNLTFTKAGTYRITVTGRNRFGETSTKTKDITVSTDITYDIQLQDAQGNAFPQNQTPRFVMGQAFATTITGRNISKVEVTYGNNQSLLSMSNPTTDADGKSKFTGNIQLAEQGQYTLTYTFYSVTKPSEKSFTASKMVLIRRPLEPLADFSVSEDGVVLGAYSGLCTVGGASKEGYKVKKNREYFFDGSASLGSSDLPVNRDSSTTNFRWTMGTQELASRTVSVRQSFISQSTDANSCIPVTFTILENVNGQAKTSLLTKYFKVENSLPTYDSFVVEWPSGTLTTPLSVRARLNGLRDPDETNQNIQVQWFYEIQGTQLFNEVSYDNQRVIRIENYGAAGSQNTVRIGAMIYDMNTKETTKVYSDQRSIKTGTNPALQTSIVQPTLNQALSYVPWVKGGAALNMQIAAKLTDGSAVTNPDVNWSSQRYGTFTGCPSVPEPSAGTLSATGLSASANFPLCGLYRITAIVNAAGQTSQQTIAFKVYDSDTLLTAEERPIYLAASNLRGSAPITAPYQPAKENTTSPFFPSGTGAQVLEVRAAYLDALSPTVARQAVTNGSYTGNGGQITADYQSVYDMLNSYNLPANVINDKLAQDNPQAAAQVQQLRSSGRDESEVRALLAKNLAGSAITYNPSAPYQMPFGTAYDVYAEFGLRPAAALNKVSQDDPAIAQRVQQLRNSGSSDSSIVQTLRNEADLTVSTSLHEPAKVAPTDVVELLVSQGLTTKEIVDKLVLDNPNLVSSHDDLMSAKSNGELLAKVEQKLGSDQTLSYQVLSPLRMSLARAYLVMKERAYSDRLILDKLRGDDPSVAASITDLESQGVPQNDLMRRLLTDPSRVVSIRVAGAIQSDFVTIFATLKRHGLSTETIYEKMQQDDDVFRVVYEAMKKKSTDITGYYQEFAQEPTLAKLNYKPESMFVLPLRLAYAEYSNMGLKPTQVFERIAKDNPNFGTDYETLKRQKSGGMEIFTSLVKNGAARKIRFSYMRPLELTADNLPAFFERQGIPETLAVEKVVQDNPQLSEWYGRQIEAKTAPTFAAMQDAFPKEQLLVTLFTGWDSTSGAVGSALSEYVSPTFALNVLGSADADMARLIAALRGQNKADAQIYHDLVTPTPDRKIRLYPYLGMQLPLRDAARQMAVLYPVESAVLAHIARFDDAFSDFYGLALRKLYTPATTLANVGDRLVYVPAFRPLMAEPAEIVEASGLFGLDVVKGLNLYKDAYPEIADLLEKYGATQPQLVTELRALYPEGQRLPLAMLVGKPAQQLMQNNMGLSSTNLTLKDYLAWLMGWGISSDVGLAQLAASDPVLGATLADAAGKPLDERINAIGGMGMQVHPQLYKRFALSFVDAFRVYERRGLSVGLIYAYMAGQDPVFHSVYEQQRLARTAQQGLFDIFKSNPLTGTVLTNPLLPAEISTSYVARTLQTQGVPSTVIVNKLKTDQPLLALPTVTTLDTALTAVARDTLLYVMPFSLTHPVTMERAEKEALFKAYGLTEASAAKLAAQTGSGLTLPPQVVVDVPTYVQQAQDLGIGTQEVIEDIIRLAPEQAPQLRDLLAQKPEGNSLTQALTGILTTNRTLPLFTKVQNAAADALVVAYGADINGTIQELSGYLPGTLPIGTGSGELLSDSGDDQAGKLLANIRETMQLPGGLMAYVYNARLTGAAEAFRFQNLETLKAENIAPDAEVLNRLASALTSSGGLMHASAPTDTNMTPANIFGAVGESTLLDCQQFAVVVTEEGEQSLVCAANTLYEAQLDTFKTVLLRLLGENMPEEMSTLMTSFERATTLEDRMEGMTRLRDRVTRLPVTEEQRQELLRRLAFVQVFTLDDALAGQLGKRSADALMTKLDNILKAAGTSMVTERGSLAQTFGAIQQQNEVGNVLMVRYSLALGDLLRSQSVDGAVKDMVLETMRQGTMTFITELRTALPQVAGAAQDELSKKLDALQASIDTPSYTFEWASTVIGNLRGLTDVASIPDAGKTDIDTRLVTLAKSLGATAATTMQQGIPQVAADRSAAETKVQSLSLESSIWERQRRGLAQFLQVLATNQTYTADQKEQILKQLFDARHAYLTGIKDVIQGGDFSEAARAALVQRLDAVLATSNLSGMLQAETPLWQYLEADAGVASSEKFADLWKRTADFQVQLFRAASNVLSESERTALAPFFDSADLSTDRQRDLLAALAIHMAELPAETLQQQLQLFATQAVTAGSPLEAPVKTFVTLTATFADTQEATKQAQTTTALLALRDTVLNKQGVTEEQKVRFFTAYDRLIRGLTELASRSVARTGVDLLASLRDTLDGRLRALVTNNPGLRPSAHVVQDLKKVVLAHPDLPLQYKLEMLFELQHAFPFSPFGLAFTNCTSVYVKDASDTVRRICLEEKNQQVDLLPVEKNQLFALMQAGADKKPDIRSKALASTLNDSIHALATDQTLTLDSRKQLLSVLAQAFEWPDVSYADRNAALAYVYSLPVISDEMLQLQETRLSLETYYISLGELESRLRAIMLGINEMPDSLKGTIRETLMQVKKYYNTDTQRSNIMLSLASNVIRGSDLQSARKDLLVRVLDTLGDTMQPVPVDRLVPEASLEQLDIQLAKLTSVPDAQGLIADREDVERLLGQNDILGSVGALSRLEQHVTSAKGLSTEEQSDLQFYSVVARDFLSYVQSQRPRVADAGGEEPAPQQVDPTPVQQPQQIAPVDTGMSPFWVILWSIVYVIAGLILIVICLGVVLYGLFLSYKRSHPDIHVDFEEYILVLRGQLGNFFKRFSKDKDEPSLYKTPEEALPQKPEDKEEAPAAPSGAPAVVQEQASVPEKATPATPEVTPTPAPSTPVSAPASTPVAPSWLQLGDEASQPANGSVNGQAPSQDVQPTSDGVQSGESSAPQQ